MAGPSSRKRTGRFSFLANGPSNLYTKPYRSIDEQLKLLIARGLTITDIEAARSCLERIGYYRLSAYWYPFRQRVRSGNETFDRSAPTVDDHFIPGAAFQQIIDLYVFDKRFRLLFLDALVRVEVALRVGIALLLGSRDPWAHRNAAQLEIALRYFSCVRANPSRSGRLSSPLVEPDFMESARFPCGLNTLERIHLLPIKA